MKIPEFYPQESGKDIIELQKEEQFTEALYALASIMRPTATRKAKRDGNWGGDPELGQSAA